MPQRRCKGVVSVLMFQSVSLEDVAPVRISNVIVSAPTINTYTEKKTSANGYYFAGRDYGDRIVTVYFYFHQLRPSQKAGYMSSIYEWAHSDAPERLEIQHYAGMYLLATCTGLPEISATDHNDIMSIEFTAHDPAFYCNEISSSACGIPFTVRGSLPAYGYILNTNASPVTDPEWTLDAGYSIALDGSVSAGEIRVETSPIYVTLDGTQIMDQVTLASRSLELTPGVHTITGTGTVYWQEKYL